MAIVDAGLILEGGGMRGVYTTGVLDRLMDEDLFFRRIYGVSAGVCHACSYLSRQRGRAARTVIDYAGDPRYASVRSFLFTGDFFGVQMVYDEVPNRLLPFDYRAFAESGCRLTAVLTNCRTGQAAYLPVRDLRQDMAVIRASSSLPLLSRMVEIGSQPYLDGGIADSIPLGRAMADGVGRSLVVLTQHEAYRKGPSGMAPVFRARYRRWPALRQAVATRHLRYNEALALVRGEQAAGRAFVIRPGAPVGIGRLEKDPGKLQALYDQGFADADRCMPALRRFLEKEGRG